MAITVKQFIERLTESGLMSAAEVSAFQNSLSPDQPAGDVQALVTALYKAGKLTKYQAKAVYEGQGKSLVFGEYTVLDQIGEGGMGVVLKAQHRRMKRTAAIKVLSSAGMKQAGAVERFHREVEAAAKLEHPNIVAAYDAGEHQGVHYLAMQYVDGKDLATIVKDREPLPIREAAQRSLGPDLGLLAGRRPAGHADQAEEARRCRADPAARRPGARYGHEYSGKGPGNGCQAPPQAAAIGCARGRPSLAVEDRADAHPPTKRPNAEY